MKKDDVIKRVQLRLAELNAYLLKEALNEAAWRDNDDAQRAAQDVFNLITKLGDPD